MRLATIRHDDVEFPAISNDGESFARLSEIDPLAPSDLMSALSTATSKDQRDRWAAKVDQHGTRHPRSAAVAPYRHPRKLLGIGLNYRSHADDLGAAYPTSPASFLKGDHTIIGDGEAIIVPPSIGRVTAEAEVGLVIGREAYRVSPQNALDYVIGIVAILDQTAEEILFQNPRFLTRAKNYPTFFSFGPDIVTLEELEAVGGLSSLVVGTYLNGVCVREDRVSGMVFSPEHLISFHSEVMPLYPGDILSTGTPGATPIAPGDVVECRIQGVTQLRNPVV